MSNLANRDYTLLRPPPNKSIVLSPRYDGVEIHQGQYLATIPWDFFVPPKTKAELAEEALKKLSDYIDGEAWHHEHTDNFGDIIALVVKWNQAEDEQA